MAKIPGTVGLGGKIAPKDSNDKYPVTDPKYGLGGLRTVDTYYDMIAIPRERKELGMIVFITNTSPVDGINYGNTYWKLEAFHLTNPNLDTWVKFESSTAPPITEIDAGNY